MNHKQNTPKIALLHTDDVGNEYEAIRQTLEYFGYEVFRKAIGRPKDFVDIISGENEFFAALPIWVLSVHGEDGQILMPELAEEVYVEKEPRGPISADFIKRNARFSQQLIISTGCTLGSESMGQAFLKSGAMGFIAPANYIEGNAALIFIHHFFYLFSQNPSDTNKAFKKASSIDKETSIFNWYKKY